MRFVLVGDGHPAAGTLRHLLTMGAEVEQVFATAGQENRGQLTRLCGDAGISLEDSELLTGDGGREAIRGPVDWLVNVNSTVILPAEVLSIPSAGALNMHPGLLPEYAGLHTHQWAIRRGASEFGVTVHEMVPSVDAGDIIARRTFPIAPDETGLSLYLKCMEEGARAMREVIEDILAGRPLDRTPQDLIRRTLYRHRDALEGAVDWTRPAEEVERFVRAGSYAPLQSPSYSPTIVRPHGPDILIDSVTVLEDAPAESWMPGEVVHTGQGPAVVCGDGMRLQLVKIRVGDRTLEGHEIATVLPAGDRLA